MAKVYRLKSEGWSITNIAQEMRRSRSGIYNILSKGDNIAIKPRSGRPKVTTRRDDRAILRLASSQELSLRQISRRLVKPVSKDTIHRRIKCSNWHVFCRMKRKPLLKQCHKDACLLWAKVCCGEERMDICYI